MAAPNRDSAPHTWRKSSYSNGEGGACLEVQDGHPTIVPVRDSKNPHGPTLTIPTPAWTTFLTTLTTNHPRP